MAARVDREQRVNALEARLQELSETVGTYDRLRQHDQVRRELTLFYFEEAIIILFCVFFRPRLTD